MDMDKKGHQRWQHHVMVFLLFVMLSACLWLLSSLGKQQTITFSIPIKYRDMPEGFVVNSRMPRTVDVEVRDMRQNLIMMRYFSDRCDTMEVSLKEWFDSVSCRSMVDNASLHNVISRKLRLGSSAKVEQFYPHELVIGYARLHKKVVPLKLSSDISLRRQYIYRSPISVTPQVVTLYGSEDALKEINEVTTKTVSIQDLSKDWSGDVLVSVDSRVKVQPKMAHVEVEVEPFTEQRVELPIVTVNVPDGMVMRTFPAKAYVVFNVGLSHYNDADSSSFVVMADYEQAQSAQDERVRLKVKSSVSFARQVHVMPQEVEFMIER